MTFWKWSKTPADNGTADNSCPWPEGMAPSQVNDSARGQMAALSKYRDDISGKLVTGGSASAYTISSNQGFDTLAHLDGAMIAFVPHADSDEAPTLNVDGLGAKPLRGWSGGDLLAGVLKEGSPYVVFYNNTSGEFVLHSYFVNQAEVPIGGGIDYWGATAPNSNWAFPYGQAISRSDYATCFSRLGTTYGSGDGSTTFNLPDRRGRLSAGKDNMGGTAAGRIRSDRSGIAGTTLGADGGADTHTLINSQLPVINPTFTGTSTTVNVTSSSPNVVQATTVQDVGVNNGSFTYSLLLNAARGGISSSGSFTPFGTVSGFGGGAAHNNMPPTIICNYLIRIK